MTNPTSNRQNEVLKTMRDMLHVAERSGSLVTLTASQCREVIAEMESSVETADAHAELKRLRKQMGVIAVLLLQNDRDEVMEWARGVKLTFKDGDPELAAVEKAPTQKHYPEEWGPSDARRLSCVCGDPDPGHMSRRAEETPAPRSFHFDRYRNGKLMAEGVSVHKQTTEAAALEWARSQYPRGDTFVLRSENG